MSLFKKSAFISFDYDHDNLLPMWLSGQAKNENSPFEITNRSVKEHLTGDWKAKVRGRIQRADLVIVICGQHTHTASGVATELEIAKEIGKPYFLLRGYSDKSCSKPRTASQKDKIYDWTWPNLKLLIGGAR